LFVVVPPEGVARSVTYAAFVDRAERAAVAFERAGIAPGDAVVVHLGTSLEFLTAWFGLLRLGALAVPTNLLSPAPEIAHSMAVSDATHVITEPRFLAAVTGASEYGAPDPKTRIIARSGGPVEGWLDLDELVDAVPAGAELDRPSPRATEPAEVLFTSGTTSKPKGAMLTHANLIRAGHRVSLHYALTDGDRVASVLPLFHTGGQNMGVMAALAVGATCVLIEQYSASAFWDQIRDHGGTFIMFVATHVRTLLATPERPDDRDHPLRRTAFGMMITDDERDRFQRRFGVELTYCYGQTEACLLIAIAPPFGPKRWPAMGLPAFDRVVRIADDDGNELPDGEVGEILVEADPGRTVMLGYVNDPEATETTLAGGWLHTGDNGMIDEAGYLHFIDRKKDMIKRSGENVSALEVETILVAHPAILEAAVVGVPDPIRGEAVKAFVVVEGERPTDEEIQEHCRTWLAPFKVPTEIEVLSELPKTSIGKVQKKDLKAR
ncbi:MAG TPA: AMP-binding protein, partial [Acidimicrobiia bacterium]|nr:AMP-binding protein [Acidimicrobiia bacterium]